MADGAGLAIEQPVSRTDRVREALRRAILDGSLQPGRSLVERELAEMLGVSKTPVREALKQLQSSGLVEVSAYQGVRVRRLDGSVIHDLYVARATAEPAAVRLATARAGATTHAAARSALHEANQLAAAGETTLLGMANRRFHRALYIACGNEFMCGFLDQLQDLTAFVATAGWRRRATYEQEAAEHAAILAAVERGESELAEQRAREHIEQAERTLLDSLEELG